MHIYKLFQACDVIDENIILKKTVVKFDQLRKIYVENLEKTEYPNPHYRSEKLKAKLIKHHHDTTLSFESMQTENGQFGSYLVFCSDMDVGNAVKQAYLLGQRDRTKEEALKLGAVIKDASQISDAMITNCAIPGEPFFHPP